MLNKFGTVSNLLKLNKITSLGSWLLGTRHLKRASSDISKSAGASASFIGDGRMGSPKELLDIVFVFIGLLNIDGGFEITN